MSISAHIERSLERVLRSERESSQLFLIDGMPMAGKTTLVKSVFADLAYVDLNDLYPRNLAHTQPKDFFAVYGKRLVVDGIEKAPKLIDYLPEDESSQIVLTGYLSLKDREKLIEKGVIIRTVMPISQREYTSKDLVPQW